MVDTFSQIDPEESVILTFDFGTGLDKGDTISSATVSAEVHTGTDTSPMSIFKPKVAVKTISNASWAASVATFTTSAVHGLIIGDVVVISGMNPVAYNGTFTITEVPTTSSFKVAMVTDPLAFVSGGSVAKVTDLTTVATTFVLVNVWNGKDEVTYNIRVKAEILTAQTTTKTLVLVGRLPVKTFR